MISNQKKKNKRKRNSNNKKKKTKQIPVKVTCRKQWRACKSPERHQGIRQVQLSERVEWVSTISTRLVEWNLLKLSWTWHRKRLTIKKKKKKKRGKKMNQEGTRDFVMCKFTNCTTLSSEWILISSSENRQLFFEQRRLTTETKRPRDW